MSGWLLPLILTLMSGLPTRETGLYWHWRSPCCLYLAFALCRARFKTEISQAARDVSASHDVLLDLFQRIDDFFKRFKVYSRSFLSTELAEVLVKVVAKVLNILSIAMKEVDQSRTSESFLRSGRICLSMEHLTIYLERYMKRLAGRKDLENALGELETLIQGEHYAAAAQVLQDTSELRRGV
jgi:hypothetical protein